MSSIHDKPTAGRPTTGKRAASSDKGDTPPATPEVGAALRSVYQSMVDEQVPDEMMDLLGKLG